MRFAGEDPHIVSGTGICTYLHISLNLTRPLLIHIYPTLTNIIISCPVLPCLTVLCRAVPWRGAAPRCSALPNRLNQGHNPMDYFLGIISREFKHYFTGIQTFPGTQTSPGCYELIYNKWISCSEFDDFLSIKNHNNL